MPSLLLRAVFAEAVTVADPAGNEKLAKGAKGGRMGWRKGQSGTLSAGVRNEPKQDDVP